MARDIGKFTNEARRAIEDFREDITQANDDEDDEEDDYTYDDEQSSTEDEDEEDDAVERDL